MSDVATIEKTESQLDKTEIRDFAVNARRKLKEKVELQANKMGFFSDSRPVQYEFEDDKQFKINGETFNKSQANILKKEIQEKGFDIVIDEVAYTWFNRFIALYYMEIHNYIENGLNIVSAIDDLNQTAMKATNCFKNLNKEVLFNAMQNNDSDGIYKTLIIAQCNELNNKLPFLFEKISDYTELLFPSGMMNNDSVIREMLALDKKNWEQVEIIGWLYQYYNQAEKDRVIQAKKKYKTNEIPFATQLFTPKWIVKYMTQNSLGRLWQETYPNSKLKNSMEFYLEPRTLTDEDKKELQEHILNGIKPENIKVYDPACGSGHILVYAYSLLYQMYKEFGYIEDEIPSLILKNNLFGLDLCKRAAQLAQLAVIFRARQDDKYIFDKYEELNVRHIEKSKDFSNEEIAFIAGTDKGEAYENIKEVVDSFKYADIYGSLCKLPDVNYEFYLEKLNELKNKPSQNLLINSNVIYQKFEPLVKQFKILKQNYECVITNPPYMGNKYMEPKLAEFILNEYKEFRLDLFTTFLVYAQRKTIKNGYVGCLTPVVWFFTSSYSDLRKYYNNNVTFTSIVQLEHNAFEAAAIPVITFTFRNCCIKYPIESIKLSDFVGADIQPLKIIEAIQKPCTYRYSSYMSDFNSIQDSPYIFSISNTVRSIFKNEKMIGDISKPRQGMATSDNNRFLRLWTEIDFKKFGLNMSNQEEAKNSKSKWFPYNKGGLFRKWYGNNEFVVNWENDGKEILSFAQELYGSPTRTIKNIPFYFKPCITWTFVAINFGVRLVPKGFLFDVAGSSLFAEDNNLKYIAGFLNSKIANKFMYLLNPTINFQSGNVATLPYIKSNNVEILNKIDKLVDNCYEICKEDWDSFETSWDFKIHPLLKFSNFIKGAVDYKYINKSEPISLDGFRIKYCFEEWRKHKEEQYKQLKEYETELNRLFIEIYGLQDEMEPDVSDEELSYFRIADEKREIKSLLSYAVGCMLGRYSLDEEGLAYAGGTFDSNKYEKLEVDEDGILPILSGTWFEDDIIEELKRFLKAAFGEICLSENMEYIADVLGRKSGESAENTIRNYFLKDFYKDHVQVYKKRPIYWLFTSGKEKAFNCLVYLHRYDKTTLSRIRKDYLHEFQAKLDRAIAQAEDEGNVKQTSLYAKYRSELLDYDAKIKDLADSQIELDLDDGVKVNYAKFKGLLDSEKDIVGKN